MHQTYQDIGLTAKGLLLGYYWNHLCGVVGHLGSGMASWIVQDSVRVSVSICIGLSRVRVRVRIVR